MSNEFFLDDQLFDTASTYNSYYKPTETSIFNGGWYKSCYTCGLSNGPQEGFVVKTFKKPKDPKVKNSCDSTYDIAFCKFCLKNLF